ncbi:hypothetical protein MRB53_015910 [Persea americana]|uniref:Uncharacterized protein n=1 Tax=Persea americana TaxID=3435 RepID=A0ACC2M1L4_PERAE|nr:hypothetical protein MRB53_015910 [Persea americana]
MFEVFQVLLFFNAGVVTPNPVIQEAAEAHALFAWKASLEKHFLLHSWSFHNNNSTSGEGKRNSPCNWFGITCNAAGRVKEINLFNASLKVTEKDGGISFSSLKPIHPNSFILLTMFYYTIMLFQHVSSPKKLLLLLSREMVSVLASISML